MKGYCTSGENLEVGLVLLGFNASATCLDMSESCINQGGGRDGNGVCIH